MVRNISLVASPAQRDRPLVLSIAAALRRFLGRMHSAGRRPKLRLIQGGKP
jgi:hypothetical protein